MWPTGEIARGRAVCSGCASVADGEAGSSVERLTFRSSFVRGGVKEVRKRRATKDEPLKAGSTKLGKPRSSHARSARRQHQRSARRSPHSRGVVRTELSGGVPIGRAEAGWTEAHPACARTEIAAYYLRPRTVCLPGRLDTPEHLDRPPARGPARCRGWHPRVPEVEGAVV